MEAAGIKPLTDGAGRHLADLRDLASSENGLHCRLQSDFNLTQRVERPSGSTPRLAMVSSPGRRIRLPNHRVPFGLGQDRGFEGD